MPLCKALGLSHAARTTRHGMKNPRILRLALSHGLLSSAFLALPAFALSSAEFEALHIKANRGNAIAQYNLGLAYADRGESTYDPVQAYAWLSLAAANGTTSKALANVTGLLTSEQLAEGKRRFAALTNSPVSSATAATSPIVAASEPAAPAPAVPEVNQDQKNLSAELAEAWKENELLKAGLTAQLADANKRIAIAEAALASKDKAITALQTKLDQAAAAPASPSLPIGVSAELASLRAERDQLQTAATTAATELAQLRVSSAKATDEQAALRAKLARATTDVADARRAQTLAEAEASSLKASADRASAERLALAAQLETLAADLAAAKEAAAAPKVASPNPLAETVSMLEQERASLTARLADATQRISSGETSLAQKEKDLAALQARLAEATASKPTDTRLEAELAAAKADRAGLIESVKTLEEQRASLTAELAAAKTAATTASTSLAAFQASASATATEYSALREKLALSETALAEARQAQAAAEATAASLKAAADRANSERLALATQLEIVTADLAAAKAAPAPQPAETLSDTGLAVLKADRDRLSDTVKSLEQERTALAAELASAKAAIPAAPAPAAPDAETLAKLADLEKAKTQTETKLEASLRTFTLQQAEIDRLQKSLAGIDAERAATATKLDAANAELNTLRPQAANVTSVSTEAETLRTQLAAANQSLADKTAALASANLSLTDARKTIDTATAELVATRDQLRQTQAQSAASAIEAQQLKTRLALVGNLPSTNTPTRPGTIPSISIDLPPPAAAPVVTSTPATTKVAAPAGPRTHTVASGDSLSRISKQYYGTAARWNDILQANKDVIRNPDALTLGTKLRIP